MLLLPYQLHRFNITKSRASQDFLTWTVSKTCPYFNCFGGDNTEHCAFLAVPCSWQVCRNHQFTAAGAVGEAAAGGGHFPREAPSAHSMAGRKKGDRQKLGMDVCWVLLTTGSPRRMLCSGLPEVSVPAGALAGSAEGCLGAAPLCLAALSRPLAVLTHATWTLSSCKYIYYSPDDKGFYWCVKF